MVVIYGEDVAVQHQLLVREMMVDMLAAPNQAQIHSPYLSKSVEMARVQLSGSNVSLSGIARTILWTEATIKGGALDRGNYQG